MLDDVLMAVSLTTTSTTITITTTTSSSSRCTSSTAFIAGASLPTISLDTVADDEEHNVTERLTVSDDVIDEVAEAKRAPWPGCDRKKHASYR